MLDIQRLACATVATVAGGRNLNSALAALWPRHPQLTAQQRSTITDLCYGTLRFGIQLEAVLAQLLTKTLQDDRLRWLLLVALYSSSTRARRLMRSSITPCVARPCSASRRRRV